MANKDSNPIIGWAFDGYPIYGDNALMAVLLAPWGCVITPQMTILVTAIIPLLLLLTYSCA